METFGGLPFCTQILWAALLRHEERHGERQPKVTLDTGQVTACSVRSTTAWFDILKSSLPAETSAAHVFSQFFSGAQKIGLKTQSKYVFGLILLLKFKLLLSFEYKTSSYLSIQPIWCHLTYWGFICSSIKQAVSSNKKMHRKLHNLIRVKNSGISILTNFLYAYAWNMAATLLQHLYSYDAILLHVLQTELSILNNGVPLLDKLARKFSCWSTSITIYY